MPRRFRDTMVDYPHHVTQRGNNKEFVFKTDGDYEKYLYIAEDCRGKYNLPILSYCLMPNHIHFIVTPKDKISLSRFFNTCHMRYTQYFNKKYDRIGHLWQGRFFSCALDEVHLYLAIKYVETNPLKAHLENNSGEWKWSSARFRLNNAINSILHLEDTKKKLGMTSEDYRAYLLEGFDEIMLETIKGNTQRGIACVKKEFNGGME